MEGFLISMGVDDLVDYAEFTIAHQLEEKSRQVVSLERSSAGA